MKVRFVNDDQRGRGYACFVCADVIEPSAKFAFSICKASDMTFLGKSGWQSAEEKHVPDSWARKDNTAALYVGPAVVDSLDENENYRLTLFAGGLAPQKSAFSITNVNRSFREGQSLVQGAVPRAAPPEEEQPETPAGPEQPPADAREEPVADTPPPARSVRLPAVFAAALALVLLLGGGLWRYARQNVNTPATDETPRTQAENPEPAPGAREQVRQFLRDPQTSAREAMTLYHALSRAPDGTGPETQDAVYRLLYFASQKGDAEATLALARCVDPATPAFGTIPKDAREAWGHYAAVVQKKPEAAHDMQTLKAWLETEAGGGNALARQWIDAIAGDAANP
ncbi:MAG: hypothetical protein LBN96_00240 [Desulfovibrio sp.]|nr:hypothetical protein [Desulfovibrio sp.]